MQELSLSLVMERIPKESKIFGFTGLFSYCWLLVDEMASAIRKKYSDALLVADGEHPNATPEHVLESGIFDVAVMGDGDVDTWLRSIGSGF